MSEKGCYFCDGNQKGTLTFDFIIDDCNWNKHCEPKFCPYCGRKLDKEVEHCGIHQLPSDIGGEKSEDVMPGKIFYLVCYENHTPIGVQEYLCLFCKNGYAVLAPETEWQYLNEELCDEYVLRRINKEKNPELIIAFVEELFSTKEAAENSYKNNSE